MLIALVAVEPIVASEAPEQALLDRVSCRARRSSAARGADPARWRGSARLGAGGAVRHFAARRCRATSRCWSGPVSSNRSAPRPDQPVPPRRRADLRAPRCGSTATASTGSRSSTLLAVWLDHISVSGRGERRCPIAEVTGKTGGVSPRNRRAALTRDAGAAKRGRAGRGRQLPSSRRLTARVPAVGAVRRPRIPVCDPQHGQGVPRLHYVGRRVQRPPAASRKPRRLCRLLA